MAQITSGSLTIVDVTDGAPGLNNTTVFLYRRAVSAPDKPTGNLTYTFSTASITGALEGWVQSINELTGSDPIWMIAAVASSNGQTDIIESSEWAGPIKMAQNGQDGLPGAPGTNGLNQATIFIYKRDDSATAPPKTVYTFATGSFTVPSGWSKTIPTEPKGKPCWVTSAIAIGAETTAELNWVTPSVLVENGSDGVSPTVTATENGVKIVDADGNETFITNGADGTSYYTFVRYSKNANGSGYVVTPTSETIYIGIYTGTESNPPVYNDSGWTWSRYVGADGQPGTPGSQGPQGVSVAATRELYYLKTNSTDPAQITNANQIHTTDDVNQWTSVVPTYIGSGKYYTCIETTLSNSNVVWGAPIENKGLTDANVNAANAIEIARGVRQHFFWVTTDKSENIPAGAYIAEQSEESFYSNPTKGNILTRSDGIWIRNGVDKLATLQGSGLTFLVPTGTYKGQKSVSLNGSGLTFYNIGSNNSAAATLASDGLQITNGSIVLGTTSGTDAGNVTLSNKNFTRSINGTGHSNLRFAIGSNFGVASDGTLYASGANISGTVNITGSGSNVPTTTEMNSAIGSIEIGGRNLITNSKNLKDFTKESDTYVTSVISDDYITLTRKVVSGKETTGYGVYLNVDVEANTSYVISGTFSGVTSDEIYCSIGQITPTGKNHWSGVASAQVITENGRYSRVFNSGEATTIRVCIALRNKNSTEWSVQISNVKLEKGNKATDWTPAPEDVQAEIDAKKSVHTLTSANTEGANYSTILGYATEGTSTNFTVVSTSGVKTGDTVRIGYYVKDMNRAVVYIVGTVTDVNNATNLRITAHGLDTTIIDGGNILTNSIGANQIKANSITTNKLAIGDFNNYITANENYPDSITFNATSAMIIEDGWLKKVQATASNVWLTPVEPNWTSEGEQYRITGVVKAPKAGRAYVYIYGRTGTTADGSVGTEALTIAANTETHFNHVITINSTVASKEGCNIAITFCEGSTGSTYQIGYCKNMKCERMSGGELIVDGSITADKIQIGAINVGGRNLLAGTQYMYPGDGSYAQKTFKADTHGTLSHYVYTTLPHKELTGAVRVTNTEGSTYQCGFFQTNVPIYVKSGTSLTISFWIRASVANLDIRTHALWYNSGSQGISTTSGKTTTEWQKIIHTTTVSTDILATATAGLIYVTNLPNNAWFEVAGLKLEIGNTATDWSDDIPVEGTNYFGSGDCATSLDGLSQSTNKFSITTKDGYKCAHITGALATTGHLMSQYSYTPQKYQMVSMSCDMRLDNYVAGSTNPLIGFYYSGATPTGSSAWIGPKWLNQTFNGIKQYISSGNIATYINNKGWVHIESTAIWYDDYSTTIPAGYVYARDFTGDLYVRNIKFEFGHKCTPWSSYPLNGKTTDAAKTASNYISASSSGIRIASANPATQVQRLELTSSSAIFYTSDGTQRLKLTSGNGVIIGSEQTGHTVVTDQGMTIYDVNNKKAAETTTNGLILYKAGSKRAAVTANGLDIFGNDGATSIASFGSTARIGSSSGSHFLMNAASLQAFNASGTKYFEVSSSGLTFGSNTAATTTNVNDAKAAAEKTATNYVGISTATGLSGGLTIASSNPTSATTNLVNIQSNNIRIVGNSVNGYSKITSTGLEVFANINSNSVSVASFGSTARIGQVNNDKSRVEIKDTGIDFYNRASGKDVVLAHIGYNTGQNDQGATTEDSYPYYTFGKRFNDTSTTRGNYSFAEGTGVEAQGYASHAEGTFTEARGRNSHAEGNSTIAIGFASHAEGTFAYANADYTHAQNYGTLAQWEYQTAIGIYNENKSENLFEIGNGFTSRSNAFEVDKYGNIKAGGLDCGKVSITPTAGQVTSKAVTFNHTFSSAPNVVATAQSSVPNAISEVTVSNVTTTGFTMYLLRSTNVSTNIFWIAML